MARASACDRCLAKSRKCWVVARLARCAGNATRQRPTPDFTWSMAFSQRCMASEAICSCGRRWG
eukprot:5922600-Pyramimonas_sp.AAC.1